MLRRKAGCSGSDPIGVRDLLCGPGFLGTAARDTLPAHNRSLLRNNKKITALGHGAIPPIGPDPEHPRFFSGASVSPFVLDAGHAHPLSERRER
jgi:hypothetical protein